MTAAASPPRHRTFAASVIRPGARMGAGLACFAVMAVAAFLLFFRLGDVRAPIWDEAYYLTATARIHDQQVQFASHPPLGLMLIAAGDAASELNRDFDWSAMARVKSIGADQIPADFDYRGPRVASALFGVLAAGLFFLLMLELSGSTSLGLILSTLFLCDPALIAQFRAAHLDAFQITFVLAALLCGLKTLKSPGNIGWTAGFAGGIAAAAMVRANGLVLGAMGLVLIWSSLRAGNWRLAVRQALAGTFAAIVVVAASFALMLSAAKTMPDPNSAAGRIDLARVSANYLAEDVWTALPAYIGDYAAFISSDLVGLGRTDQNASHPWQWLIGSGAITYRWDAGDGMIAAIGLIPNRPAWLLSLVGVALAVGSLRKRPDPKTFMLIAGWLASMALLFWLDGQRMMYAYHYFIPLLLGHAILAGQLNQRRIDERVIWGALAAVTCFCVFAMPLALNQRVSSYRCGVFLDDCGQSAARLAD